MKNILFSTLFLFTILSGCKDDTPVDTNTNPDSFGDARDAILGDYTCNYAVFNAVTGVEDRKGSFSLKIYPNPEDDTQFDFRIDGLTKFMTGANMVKVSDGYSFSIPAQIVKDFGDIKGKKIINVPQQTVKVAGYFISSTKEITVYCERTNKGAQDDDIFEFNMTRE